MAAEFFTLEAVPARYGDCLLLHYGTEDEPGLALIDGGPDQVWKPFLEKRLAELRDRRGEDFRIDLLMVSHIDDDHVLGIGELASAWRSAKAAGERWPYPVKQAWFNSFERISNARNLGAVTASVTASTGAATLRDLDLDRPEIRNPNKSEALAGLKVLASVANASNLRKDLKALGVPINRGFAGDLVRPGAGPAIPFELGPELTFHIAAPLARQLERLQLKFARDLAPEDALAAYTDGSVPNLSSIAALACYKGRTMLLTGDARGDYLIEGLKGEGLLADGGTLHVDILKMPHHGSDRNVDPDFFATVTADHYVVSADGTFGNPDRPTLETLIERRGKAAEYVIHLTYPLARIDARRKEIWEKKEGRRAWNPEEDDLAALFRRKWDEGYRFKLSAPAAAGQSERVDLLEPLGF
ncbi:MAG TPA: MBL fold metallo-hydrolase [Allosphingosinicella sp.]|jgi:hypothetical protein